MCFFNPKAFVFFLFLHKNIFCGYSLEAPHRGTSNEYPQHMFSWRNKKNIYLPTLIWTYDLPFLISLCLSHVPSTAFRLSKDRSRRTFAILGGCTGYLSLCWSRRSYCRFCPALTQITSILTKGYMYVALSFIIVVYLQL